MLYRWPRTSQAQPTSDLANLIADLEHRVKWWRQPNIGDFAPKDLVADLANEAERALNAIRGASQVVQERCPQHIIDNANLMAAWKSVALRVAFNKFANMPPPEAQEWSPQQVADWLMTEAKHPLAAGEPQQDSVHLTARSGEAATGREDGGGVALPEGGQKE
jgi:hypothetical protein